jgi:Flp pilus assembly protein TadD
MSGPGGRQSSLREWWFGLGLVAATFLAYLPALPGKFVWDDDWWTTKIAGLLRDSSGLWAMWCKPTALQQYYPLTGTTFWLDHHLWGSWTLPYHVENVLLHAVGALLFWRLLRRLQVPGAWLAAAIFALHPVMAESADWITQRKNVLSLVLYLGALLTYGRFARFWEADQGTTPPAANSPPRRWGVYGLALLLFVAADLSKATAFSLPAVLLLVCWWKRGRIRWQADVLPSLPFFAVALGLGLLTAWLEKTTVGAKGPEWAITFPERCLIAGQALWFYTGKLLWPANLCFLYPRWQLSAGSPAQWLYPGTAAGMLWGLWLMRGRIGRGPATAAFFFAGTLFPVLGFLDSYFMRYSFVCDHWVYLSSLGLITLGAGLMAGAVGRLGRPVVLCGIAAVLLPVLGVMTWRQSQMYSDIETLWRTTLARNPNAFLAHNNFAVILREQGHLDEAISHLQKAVEIQPGFAEAYNNLGNALRQRGQTDLAIAHFQKALQLEPNNAPAYGNLGSALLEKGQVNEAIAQFRKALQVEPTQVDLLNNLAYALLRNGQGNQAIALLQTAIELRPRFADAHNNLGNLLIQSGQVDEAIACYRKALELQPNNAPAHSNLGRALLQKGQLNEALPQFQMATQLSPNSAEVENDLAGALIQGGKLDEARIHLQKALAIRPGFAEAHNNLALTFLRAGQVADAITQFQQALTLQPNNAPAHSHLGQVLLKQGRWREAIDHYQAALAIQPDDAYALNNLAWVLATCPEASARNGSKAVELAQQAEQLSKRSNPSILGTLAAAYAEAGRFPEATTTAQRALELASTQTNNPQVPTLRARIRLYQARIPFRDSGETGK